MSIWTRIRLWWLRRWLHVECVEWQLQLWCGHDAPMGACMSCLPRMLKIRELTLGCRARLIDRAKEPS